MTSPASASDFIVKLTFQWAIGNRAGVLGAIVVRRNLSVGVFTAQGDRGILRGAFMGPRRALGRAQPRVVVAAREC